MLTWCYKTEQIFGIAILTVGPTVISDRYPRTYGYNVDIHPGDSVNAILSATFSDTAENLNVTLYWQDDEGADVQVAETKMACTGT